MDRIKSAFTLIELMVVIAIIGLLIGILTPALSRAKSNARRTACATNLRQVGTTLRLYMDANHERFPFSSFMPSIGPAPLTIEKPIFVADILVRSSKSDPEIFHCPNDQPGSDRLPPNVGLSYFQSEHSSYEFRAQIGGQKLDAVINRIQQFTDRVVPENMFWIFRDYHNFHGAPGTNGSRRYLYIDGHVSDYEN